MKQPSSSKREQFQTILDDLVTGPLRSLSTMEQAIFSLRFWQYLGDVERPLQLLYAEHPRYSQWLNHFLHTVAKRYAERPGDLRLLDLARVSESDWFQKPEMMGYVAYTDRLAGTLKETKSKIPYLQELGVTYLHLMPLLEPRPGANDGGYAVINYRQVNPQLGTMADLADLATELRSHGLSLCIDLVCNHTAKEHKWAQKALAGKKQYQDYYLMFPDRTLPDEYEKSTPEVFPDFAPGNFSYYEQIDKWVWTTFYEYQWDLNYTNPAVFAEMLDTILFLANQGVEILRLDAVAFMWKRLGTDSQNQPEAHAILQAWRALTRIAAPGLLLLAEAIVSPEKLIPYLGKGEATDKECELAYHNVFMVLLWSMLAERKVVLATHALQQMPTPPSTSAWLTYVRCHDDIGWAVTDEDASAVDLSGFTHRTFLSDFYSGRFPHTFARGTTFQYNPKTGDRRINGSLASLAGLEIALEQQDKAEIELAIRRILLLHSLIFAFGGIPLIYMGDEIGLLNDHSYQDDPHLAADSRWLHRPRMNWAQGQQRHDPRSITGRIFQGLQQLIAVRQKMNPFHARARTRAVWTHNDRVFGLVRESQRGHVLILASFSEQPQTVSYARLLDLGFAAPLIDHLAGTPLPPHLDIILTPYQPMWLSS